MLEALLAVGFLGGLWLILAVNLIRQEDRKHGRTRK